MHPKIERSPDTGPSAKFRHDADAETLEVAGETTKPSLGPARFRKFLKIAALGGVAVVVVVGLVLYWRYQDRHPSTSDAYVNAHVVRIAAEVTGRIASVPVADHQHVERGQVLLTIDAEPFRVAADGAKARLDLAQRKMEAAAAAVDQAKATVDQRQARLNDVDATTRRTLELVARGTLPEADADNARAALEEARAGLAAASAAREVAERERATAAAGVRAAQVDVDRSLLDLRHTTIEAPVPGVLGEIQVRPGNMIAEGQALFPLVEDHSFWIDANYKETDLARIRSGQPATVSLDIYPDRDFQGVVESVSPASGVAFSLLPPENATGNWVKVTQRFPVKIRLTDEDPSHPFRIGASTEVTIDTTADHE